MANSRNIIAIFGPSSSGKSSAIQKVLSDFSQEVSMIKNITTRLMREKEQKQGSDYVHVSKQEFAHMLERGNIIEHVTLYGNSYALPVPEVDCGIVALDAYGIAEAKAWGKKHNTNVVAIGLKAAPDTRKRRMKWRGDSEESIQKRLKDDQGLFCESNYKLCDFIINGEESTEAVSQKISFIISSLLDLWNKQP